ncbi:hypothetical protein HELRODRAFT_163864 [Helobdella robusta]|uniref:UBA domain-containing protein n=1 Tax=Helobdella robusta TaxID=6412 RepID=T1EUJ9_HELRO|nr:hypothetical protein HELRODRAFT_163864 [Helobdella robusta]ESN96752.1 hypothetical protein HELRODRAFT_163864 [Helobdella robusta]
MHINAFYKALYNIDHMSDDEGDIDDDDEMDTEPQDRPRRENDNPFTRLVENQGLVRPYGNTPVSSSAAQPGPGLITSDFFRQAMMFASGIQPQEQHHQPSSAAASAPQSLQQPDNVLIEIQMQQLREMGIMDEGYARRVLMETGGDIEAAIERLFSEDTF